MGTAFHIKLDCEGENRTVVCGGELDIASAPTLIESLDLCAERKPSSMHIDGTDLTFIDSAGISALIGCAHRCAEDGITFSVTLSDQVHDVLARAGSPERLVLGRSAPTPR